MKIPESINVENTFADFVRTIEGEIVSDIVGSSPNFSNADYLFREYGVVAELKCLQKDVLEDPAYKREVNQLFDRWITQGLIPDLGFGLFRVRVDKLPVQCQRDFFQLIRKPIRRAIEKANKQIRETKIHLNLPEAKGLLLFANDGCWSLESDAVVYLLDISLGDRFGSIHSLVYLTVNMPARLPDVDRDVLIWLQGVRKGIEPVNRAFLQKLASGWTEFYGRVIGEDIPRFIVDDHKQLVRAKFIRTA
jgi:hypothetical protein